MTLFQRVLKVRKRVVFRHCGKNYVGWCEPGHQGTISIDLRKATNPGKIYLHECLHSLFPMWSETEVLRVERLMWKKLTIHQRYLLYKKLFRHSFVVIE